MDIKEALGEIFLLMGKPKKIICDNEPGVNTLSIRNYFINQGIELHFTTPNNKPSNGDIERFHNTLNEQLRIIMIKPDSERQYVSEVLEALSHYNNCKHSATGRRPIELQFDDMTDEDRAAIHERLINNRDRNISKVNKNRKEEEIDPTMIRIFERNKIRPLYRKIDGALDENDKNYVMDKKNKKKHYKAVFKKKKKKFNY
jgi:hypothetical protein